MYDLKRELAIIDAKINSNIRENSLYSLYGAFNGLIATIASAVISILHSSFSLYDWLLDITIIIVFAFFIFNEVMWLSNLSKIKKEKEKLNIKQSVLKDFIQNFKDE